MVYYLTNQHNYLINFDNNYQKKNLMGIGDWGLGIGDWGLGPNPHPPTPNPQPPTPTPPFFLIIFKIY